MQTPEKLNVVVLNDYAHINGGASKVAIDSAVGLAGRGWRVTFFAAVGPIDDGLRAAGVNVVCSHQSDLLSDPRRIRAAANGLWNRTARRELSRMLEALDPGSTIVHVHLWYKALSTSVLREVVRRKLPVTVTLHDYTVACPNGAFFNYPRNEICRLRALGGRCLGTNCDPRGRAHKVWRVARNLVQLSWGGMPSAVRSFVCVSEFSRRILADYLPGDAAVRVILNPIDVARGEAVAVERNEAFCFVGRLSAQKVPQLLARAGQAIGAAVVFIGDGELRAEVEGLNPRATVTGWLDHAATLKRLAQARALVLTSGWYETQGMVVAEAAALGIPAIVPDTSAARDLVADGQTGYWFKGGDQSSLQERMQLLRDPERAATMGREAFARYWQDPSTTSRHLDALETLYEKLLASPENPRPAAGSRS